MFLAGSSALSRTTLALQGSYTGAGFVESKFCGENMRGAVSVI